MRPSVGGSRPKGTIHDTAGAGSAASGPGAMTDEIVELDYSLDEAGAWLARAVLEAHGIPSEVISSFPTGAATRVRLAVRAQDVDAAVRLLKTKP
jgi:hypothetical protein